MGASNSKIEEDKALQLCRDRRKFVKQALDGRCSLAASHVTYIHALKSAGTVLTKLVEPEAPTESALQTSDTATPEPVASTEKSLSQISLSPLSMSQYVGTNMTLSPSPSPPNATLFHTNHMKFMGTSVKKVEEKLNPNIVGLTTHDAERPETFSAEASPFPSETPQWDYFAFLHPIDHQFSSQEFKGMSHGFENDTDNMRGVREEEGIAEPEDEDEKSSFNRGEESHHSDDDFNEPATDTLIRSFENVNRVPNHGGVDTSTAMASTKSVDSETKSLNGEKSISPGLSPLRATSSVGPLPTHTYKTPSKEDGVENKVASQDLFSSIREIEFLFIKASESGKEVPRMLEANKLHFRPILTGNERNGSISSTFFKACFSCGEDPSQVQEEPAQTGVRYLTWHRTTSSRSSSSRNLLGENIKDDIGGYPSNSFDNSCMISGSHASTLDRLYAWERKLYDEVKASEMVRREYDLKCKMLRQLESKEVSSQKIDKIRAIVKDLHSRIRVAIHRVDSISKRIEELRDKELQPQLEELIEGLSRMWKVMSECHKLQLQIITAACTNPILKRSLHLETRRQIILHLEEELTSLPSSFKKWILAQEAYLQAINGWLLKCVSLPQKFPKRNRRSQPPSVRHFGPPPIYITCSVWLEKLTELPTQEVIDAVKGLAIETERLLPSQEKHQGKGGPGRSLLNLRKEDSGIDPMGNNKMKDGTTEDWMISGFDHFQSSLVQFFGQLSKFSEASVNMYKDLDQAIQEAKWGYDQSKSR